MTTLIIGSGVAGMTAAMWLGRYHAPFDWVSHDGVLGGMLATVHNPIVDYPGIHAEDGAAAVSSLLVGFDGTDEPSYGAVERIRAVDDGFDVIFGDHEARYDRVLVATGTRRRTLDIPGETEGMGRWVLTSTTLSTPRSAGRRVMMVGGADAAVEGSLNLVDAGAAEVILVARSPLRAQRHFVARLQGEPRIQQWPEPATPVSIEPLAEGCRVTLDTGARVDVDLVFIRIGVVPVRPRFDPRPRLDERGFIVVNGRGETDVPGLFAAGDVTSTPLRSIATSVGDATRAARSIAESLEIWT